MFRIQHRKIRFRGRPHVFQGMQETEVILSYHAAAIHTDTSHLQCSPHRIAGEQFIVGRNTGKFHHAELHNNMIDEFLCFLLCQNTIL